MNWRYVAIIVGGKFVAEGSPARLKDPMAKSIHQPGLRQPGPAEKGCQTLIGWATGSSSTVTRSAFTQ